VRGKVLGQARIGRAASPLPAGRSQPKTQYAHECLTSSAAAAHSDKRGKTP